MDAIRWSIHDDMIWIGRSLSRICAMDGGHYCRSTRKDMIQWIYDMERDGSEIELYGEGQPKQEKEEEIPNTDRIAYLHDHHHHPRTHMRNRQKDRNANNAITATSPASAAPPTASSRPTTTPPSRSPSPRLTRTAATPVRTTPTLCAVSSVPVVRAMTP